MGGDIDAMSIKLTNLVGSFFSNVVGLDGDEEYCLCIPLKRNCLKPTPKGHVYLNCCVLPTVASSKIGITHYVQMRLSPADEAEFKKNGYERLPYLGSMQRGRYHSKKKRYNSDYKVRNINDNE